MKPVLNVLKGSSSWEMAAMRCVQKTTMKIWVLLIVKAVHKSVRDV